MIDENRYLLSDSDGVMYILALMLSPTPSSAPSIYCTALGVVMIFHFIAKFIFLRLVCLQVFHTFKTDMYL